MVATVSDFRTRFPEFSDNTEFTDSRVQLMLDDATLYMGTDEQRWCNKYNIAQSYLAAHLLTESERTGAGDSNVKAGAIVSKSAGGVSVTRQASTQVRSDVDNFYMSTAYGHRFILIRDGCFVGMTVAAIL